MFVREHPDESVLVLAARAEARITLDVAELSDPRGARTVFGDALLETDAHVVVLHATHATFGVWSLPPVVVPEADRG
ncbi:hypothetical protein GCM10009816_27590 [Microbacterium aquimaris]